MQLVGEGGLSIRQGVYLEMVPIGLREGECSRLGGYMDTFRLEYHRGMVWWPRRTYVMLQALLQHISEHRWIRDKRLPVGCVRIWSESFRDAGRLHGQGLASWAVCFTGMTSFLSLSALLHSLSFLTCGSVLWGHFHLALALALRG